MKRFLATLLTSTLLLSVVAQTPPPVPVPDLEDIPVEELGPDGVPPMVITPNLPADAAGAGEEEMILKGTIKFPGAELDLVLQIYANLVERTILRPSNLPQATITLETQTDLTKTEAIQALDAVLALNGISMINIGEKFVKAVPMAQAGQEGAPVESVGAEGLPELGQYVSHVVQLRYVQTSEVIPALQPFAKIPNSVLAIESSNILILRDFTENVKRMLEMIERIDVQVESDFISEVIPIKYALAADIAGALNDLSSGGGSSSVGTSRRASATANARTRAGATPNPYTPQQNNMQNNMQNRGMNTRGATTGGSFTDRLRNIINRASVSGELEILGQTRIIADERTNSLLIFASKQDMVMIKDIISKLDVVLAQVLIEALVIEVNLNESLDYGISYLQAGSEGNLGENWSGGGGIINGPTPISASSVTPGAESLLSGFSYFAQYKDDIYFAAQALASEGKATVLSRPKVQTSHAVEATLFVGDTRPYPTGSSYGGLYGSYSSIQQLQIGITLTVLPLINPDGLVVMDIAQVIENLGDDVLIDGNAIPSTQRAEANAKVAVKSGEAIVLGGIIRAEKRRGNSGVPLLKDIPGLGLLFRSQANSDARKELMIFIRPTVLETPEIAARVAIEEKNKMPGVLQAERALTQDYDKAMEKFSEDIGEPDYSVPDTE